MTYNVPSLVAKASSLRKSPSPLDVVMGENWTEVDLGRPLRLSLLYAALKKQDAGAFAKQGGGGSAKLRVPLSIVSRSPQAMVKVIRKGGTTNARGMGDQMSYLSKDGTAPLERSERYFGIELDEEAQQRLIKSWGLSGETKTQSDKTTHIVVSFPADTDHDAAYRAGRAWAEEMFASGRYGDVYDYYTAFHTDRAHLHIHVVINRRGMENDEWLKISRRSQFNYDEFRAVQVEVAAREGIYLEASPRLARGETDRPIPDAEIRRAEREGRRPQAPSHTPVTALRSAAGLLLYSQQMTAEAEHLRSRHPALAEIIQQTAETITAGQQVMPGRAHTQKPLTHDEVKKASEFIMSRRNEILKGIKQIDAELSTLPIGPDRSRLERDASKMKAETAELLPDVAELQLHTIQNEDGLYQGFNPEDGREREVKEDADKKVAALAKSAGLRPEQFIARFDGGEAVSQKLADSWRKDELEDIQKNLTYQDKTPQDRYEQLAQEAYDDLHRNALQTYRKAERDLDAHRARKKQLHRIARLLREGRHLDATVEDGFAQTVKDTLHANELRALEAGQAEAFKHVTDDVDQQRALSRRYLEAEQQNADGARKLQLSTALAKIDRDADLAARNATQNSKKDRGIDL